LQEGTYTYLVITKPLTKQLITTLAARSIEDDKPTKQTLQINDPFADLANYYLHTG
jgi:hypothetical protein